MARVQKIDNANLKRFARSTAKRKSREVKIFFLIVCEGAKTEPNYFKNSAENRVNVILKLIVMERVITR